MSSPGCQDHLLLIKGRDKVIPASHCLDAAVKLLAGSAQHIFLHGIPPNTGGNRTVTLHLLLLLSDYQL